MRIADAYRRQIIDGDLTPGDKLPTVQALATEHGVSTATVKKALSQLTVEGYIYTSPRQGSYVSDTAYAASSPRDRLERVNRTGSVHGSGETIRVTSAQLVVPPVYVAELYDIEPGMQVVRREWVTGRGQSRLMLSVSWHPAEFAVQVPDLLSTAPGAANDLITKILTATGRVVTHARDDFHARQADKREAGLLGMSEGGTILAGAHRWSDDLGLIEYGEWCLPALHTIGYEYTPGASN
jgi:GntR family transcriptional regulator